MYRASMVMAVIAIAPLSFVLVALVSENWWEGLIVGAGLSVGFLVLSSWRPERYSNVAIPALVFSFLVWLVVAMMGTNPLGFFGFALLGGVLIPRLPTRQVTAGIALGTVAALAGGLHFISNPFSWTGLVMFVLLPGGLSVFIAAVILMLERHRVILRDLQQAAESEAELALLSERMRFASDLHDIQGHTLHVVNLKVALAQELLESDPQRAGRELHEVYTLVGETIARTKELAYGQRRLNLGSELENAKNLFEAAEVTVRIEREEGSNGEADELLGQVLREATTNILRHAQATEVTIRLSRSSIEIINDGSSATDPLRLRGLAILRERVEDEGGQLTAKPEGGRFVTRAQFSAEDGGLR